MIQQESISLLQVISVTLGVVSAVVGAATAYLRLFVANSCAGLREVLTREINDGFVRRLEVDDIRRRLDKVEEAQADRIRRTKED